MNLLKRQCIKHLFQSDWCFYSLASCVVKVINSLCNNGKIMIILFVIIYCNISGSFFTLYTTSPNKQPYPLGLVIIINFIVRQLSSKIRRFSTLRFALPKLEERNLS